MSKENQSSLTSIPRAVVLVGLAGILLGTGILFLIDPAQHAIYPLCAFHRLTGLDCPGCGGLRAVHQLTHGHLAAAFRLNALVVLAAPVGAFLAGRWLWRWVSGKPAGAVQVRPVWVWALLALLVVFGIVRNLPLPLLAQLSP